MAFSRTGSASSRLKLEPRPKLRPIAPNPGVGTWMLPKEAVLTILTVDRGFLGSFARDFSIVIVDKKSWKSSVYMVHFSGNKNG